jgi:hypothetical protein
MSLADGSRASFSGYVSEAAMLGGEGGLARYRLRLAPWLWRLTQVRNSRVLTSSSLMRNKIMKKQNVRSSLSTGILFFPILFCISACRENLAPVAIHGYNHTNDRSIYSFAVNGAMGSNPGPLSGGGKESCCISLPATWRAGLKAKIAWKYDSGSGIPTPPPPQMIEIDIPKYKHPGNINVHFYGNDKIKITISNCGIEHPFYPMSKEDILPWLPSGTKEEALDSQRRGGMTNDC